VQNAYFILLKLLSPKFIMINIINKKKTEKKRTTITNASLHLKRRRREIIVLTNYSRAYMNIFVGVKVMLMQKMQKLLVNF